MRGENRRLRAVLNRVDRLNVPQAIEDEFSRYRDDPVGFAKDVRGH